LIAAFIDEQRAAGRGVESICTALRSQALPVAPRTYRAWKSRPASPRTIDDAAVIKTLRGLQTGGRTAGRGPRCSTGGAR
jgi:hypothetical protein